MLLQQLVDKQIIGQTAKQNYYLEKYLELVNENLNNNIKDCYYEKHHIIPKTYFKHYKLAVDNSKDNLVNLLFVDHLKAHWLLFKAADVKWFKQSTQLAINLLLKINSEISNQFFSYENWLDAELYLLEQLNKNIYLLKSGQKNYFWTDEKINWLKINYLNYSIEDCAKILNTTEKAIRRKALALNLVRRPALLTDEEVLWLKENSTKYTAKEIGTILNKKRNSIKSVCHRLALKTKNSR